MSFEELSGWDEVTVRPISSWPGGPLLYRRSPFGANWSDTVKILGRELRMLAAKRVVLELAITEVQIRQDGKPYARAMAQNPGVVLSFDSRHGPLRYATGEYESWQANLRAIALALESLRRVDRYGVSRHGEQYRGWKQLGAGGDAGRGRALIDQHGGVRAALKATHPDAGGDQADFEAVRAAQAELARA